MTLPHIPVSLCIATWLNLGIIPSLDPQLNHIQWLPHSLQVYHREVLVAQSCSQPQQKQLFQVGDLILVSSNGSFQQDRLQPCSLGPCQVTLLPNLSQIKYKLNELTQTTHVNDTKSCHPRHDYHYPKTYDCSPVYCEFGPPLSMSSSLTPATEGPLVSCPSSLPKPLPNGTDSSVAPFPSPFPF